MIETETVMYESVVTGKTYNINELRENVVWTDSPDETVCAIEHWDGDKLVRRQVNIYLRKGLSTMSLGGNLG